MATKLISRNPTTGELIKELDVTPIEELPTIFERARSAQKRWAAIPVVERATYLLQLREAVLDRVDELVDIICKENGKPRFEAMANEIFPVVDMITYFAKRSPKFLRDRPIALQLMKHRKSYLNYWPVGVVLVISPWNYPFMLPMGDLILAVIAGNTVVLKPSEVTPCVGLKIQELFYDAGFPPGVLQTVIGDGVQGAACVEQKPNKIFFTGSPSTGRRVMAAAANHLIPVNLELGGKDAMIVMPDANLDLASSAALWGGFSNAGQICASVERVIVHEQIKDKFLKLLKDKTDRLRIGPSHAGNNDLGAITFEKQKLVYTKHLEEARDKKAVFVSGGEFSTDRRFLTPTIVTGSDIENMAVYKEETFGPVLAVTTFKTAEEAIQKANQSKYGLLGSVFTSNIPRGEEIAKKLAVGTVTVNEVTYTGGLGETPWGGVKESGFGRTHSDIGLYEFVNIRHIHKPRRGFPTFKSPWWFPYTPRQFVTFRMLLELYRKSWPRKLKAIPSLIWNFLKFVLTEKRI